MGKVHEYIEDRGIEWAALRPTWFIENFSTFYLKSIRDDNWIPTSMGDGKVPYIAVEDIAQVAYEALTDEKSHNTDHIIVGPHAYTHDEIATILSQILGRKIEHSRLSDRDAVRFWVESLGFPEAVVPAMIAIEHRTAQGSEYDAFIKPIDGKVVGKVRLEDFIRANRELWVPQAKN
ncbi:hypothetical protein H0H93_000605 [Arthromyces matolae]|nr:hypothetical protein H0H93_000605 [Arthromyces matolae]